MNFVKIHHRDTPVNVVLFLVNGYPCPEILQGNSSFPWRGKGGFNPKKSVLTVSARNSFREVMFKSTHNVLVSSVKNVFFLLFF